jgi:hypothetical protein
LRLDIDDPIEGRSSIRNSCMWLGEGRDLERGIGSPRGPLMKERGYLLTLLAGGIVIVCIFGGQGNKHYSIRLRFPTNSRASAVFEIPT